MTDVVGTFREGSTCNFLQTHGLEVRISNESPNPPVYTFTAVERVCGERRNNFLLEQGFGYKAQVRFESSGDDLQVTVKIAITDLFGRRVLKEFTEADIDPHTLRAYTEDRIRLAGGPELKSFEVENNWNMIAFSLNDSKRYELVPDRLLSSHQEVPQIDLFTAAGGLFAPGHCLSLLKPFQKDEFSLMYGFEPHFSRYLKPAFLQGRSWIARLLKFTAAEKIQSDQELLSDVVQICARLTSLLRPVVEIFISSSLESPNVTQEQQEVEKSVRAYLADLEAVAQEPKQNFDKLHKIAHNDVVQLVSQLNMNHQEILKQLRQEVGNDPRLQVLETQGYPTFDRPESAFIQNLIKAVLQTPYVPRDRTVIRLPSLKKVQNKRFICSEEPYDSVDQKETFVRVQEIREDGEIKFISILVPEEDLQFR